MPMHGKGNYKVLSNLNGASVGIIIIMHVISVVLVEFKFHAHLPVY